MMVKTLIAAAALSSAAMLATPASAMPTDNLAKAASTNIEQVRWVCGPFRCWWRPNYWGPGYGAYGFYRPFWRHRWGWRRWGW